MSPKLEIPEILAYPTIRCLDDVPSLLNMFVYVIKKYDFNGISILIKRISGDVHFKFGNWNGEIIHPSDEITSFMSKYVSKIVAIMKMIKLEQAQYFVTNDTLVDVQLSLNKMMGPGMMRDIFSKVITVQEQVCEPLVIDDDGIKKIKGLTPVILKPSYFRIMEIDDLITPMYAVVD